MRPKRVMGDPASLARIAEERRRLATIAQRAYRDRALAMLPHVCAACGREFSGKRLRELTVHHLDHNYKNNPADGSNWQLLCLYCHDYEHDKRGVAEYGDPGRHESASKPSIFSPFAGLDTLLSGAENPPEADAPPTDKGASK